MKKRLIGFGLALSLFVGTSSGIIGNAENSYEKIIVLQINNSKMMVEGKQIEIDPGRNTAPKIIDGRTLLPIRALIEAMGGKVQWQGDKSKAIVNVKETSIELVINDKNISINESKRKLDTAPVILEGRTFLPLRAVAETIGCKVDWRKETQSIVINYNPEKIGTLVNNIKYPLKTDVTLKYWCPLSEAQIYGGLKSFSDTLLAKQLELKTGVKIEYINPEPGKADADLKVRIASNNLPDIIEYHWERYPGGPEEAINNDVIISLNGLIEKNAPSLRWQLSQNKEMDMMLKTDSHKYYAFPLGTTDNRWNGLDGPIVRKDWLDELGMAVPVTINDWYNMLTAFKTVKNSTKPFVISDSYSLEDIFGGAFGICRSSLNKYGTTFFVENGKVKYGPKEKGYKDFLGVMKKWYLEGLIDIDYSKIKENDVFDRLMMTKKSGATIDSIIMFTSFRKVESNAPLPKFVGAQYPVNNIGETSKFNGSSTDFNAQGAAISTTCKNPEIAAMFLDYGYSEEGNLLMNYGIENQSYKMINGSPKFEDYIFKMLFYKDSMKELNQFSRIISTGPFIRDYAACGQLYNGSEDKEALVLWDNTTRNKYKLPAVIISRDKYNILYTMAEIKKYMDELQRKFITGEVSLDEFDNYIAKTHEMGLDSVLKAYQEALDRYYKR